MATKTTDNTITLSEKAVRRIGGMVVLPLRKWEQIEENLEDLKMYRSESLAEEIAKRRKEKGAVPLEKVLKKYNI